MDFYRVWDVTASLRDCEIYGTTFAIEARKGEGGKFEDTRCSSKLLESRVPSDCC